MNPEENNNSSGPTGWGDGSAPIPCPPDCEANHQHYYPKTEKVESDPVTDGGVKGTVELSE